MAGLNMTADPGTGWRQCAILAFNAKPNVT
jgi:hypothetical protein